MEKAEEAGEAVTRVDGAIENLSLDLILNENEKRDGNEADAKETGEWKVEGEDKKEGGGEEEEEELDLAMDGVEPGVITM